MRVEGPDLLLSSHQANSVALVLNEMVQNAVEHGFKVTDEGEIRRPPDRTARTLAP